MDGGMQPESLSVGVMITSYNTWELSLECARACLALDGERLKQVLVYDDCSPQMRTVEFPEQVTVHRAAENTGLCRALNVAYGMMKTDVVVQYDSDAYPLAAFAERLQALFAADPKLGIVGFRTTGRQGQRTESSMKEPNLWGLLLGQALFARLERWLGDHSGRINITMCSMGVRKAAFDAIGGFDEGLDFLDIDQDFSMRMRRGGWRVMVCEDLHAFHEGGGTQTKGSRRLLLFYKARWYLLRKFGKVPAPALVKALILLRLRVELVVLQVLGRKLFPDAETRADKLKSRRDLIAFCREHY